jgi:putative membrane protein
VLTLAVLFGLEWLALAISPRYRQDWALETVLTVVFVAVLIALHRRLSLSSVSYTALFVFLSLRQEEQKPAHHVA